MNTILTMENGGQYRTFQIFSDGSAKENGKYIYDFAVRFAWLVINGWKTVSETNLPDTKTEAKTVSVRETETFADQWDAYLREYSDNLEVEYA